MIFFALALQFFILQVNKILYPKGPSIDDISIPTNPDKFGVIDIKKEKFLFFFRMRDNTKKEVEYDLSSLDASIKV